MSNFTSALGAAIGTEGLLLYVGTGASPETLSPICNATDLTVPIKRDVVDVTNYGDTWHRRFPTLADMGKISFKVYWVMEEPSHRNSVNGGSVAAGLRYLLVQGLQRDFAFVYPDGNNSTDSFPAFVTGFQITGKVGGVFEATIELSNNGAPSLV